jgi:general secretion pathway protein D
MLRNAKKTRLAFVLWLASAFAAAAPKPAKQAQREYETAQHLLQKGDIEAALEHADKAKDLAPADVRYYAYAEFVRQVRSARQLKDAKQYEQSGKYDAAVTVLHTAMQKDPNNPELASAARDAGLHAIKLPAVPLQPQPEFEDSPELVPRDPDRKRDFHLRGPATQVLSEFFRQFGITLQIDPSVQSKQVRIDMPDADYRTALAVVLKLTHAFIVPASPIEGVAYNDTQEMRANQEHLFVQSFDISAAGSQQNINEITNSLRAVFNLRFIGQTTTGKLVLKGPRTQVVEAARFLQMAQSARPELMLDIDEIEISDSLARNVGLQVPLQFQVLNVSSVLNQAGVSDLNSLITQINAGTLSQSALTALSGLLTQLQTPGTGVLTFGGGKTQEALIVPTTTTLNVFDQKNYAHLLNHLALRAMAGAVANYHDGFRYPIVSTTFSPLVNSALTNRLFGNQTLAIPPPAVEYVDLGISLKITPLIQNNKNVTLNFELQVKNISGQSINQVPILSSREFSGTITIKEGESAVLAGLEEETILSNATGLPGLASIGLAPLGGLYTKNHQKNQILITLTPRAVRLPQKPVMAFPE